MTDIDWRVLKSNADAERAQLNRILADIRDTINTSAESTLLQANATSTLTTEQGLSGMATAWRDTNARVTRNGNNITALAEDITFLSARVDDLDEDMYGEAGALQLLSARVDSNEDGITANANSLLKLGALTPDGSAFLLDSATVLVSPSQSLAQWRTELNTSLDDKANSSTVTALSNTVTQQGNTLTAHGTQLSGLSASVGDNEASINELREVSASGLAGNALVNPGFETGIEPWSPNWVTQLPLPSGWYRYTDPGSGIRTGAASLRINESGTIFNRSRIKVVEGQAMRVGFWSRMVGSAPTAGSVIELVVRNWAQDGSQVAFSGTAAMRYAGAMVYGWELTSADYYPPPGTVEITLGIRTRNQASGSWLVDDVFVEPRSNALTEVMAKYGLAVQAGGDVAGMQLLAGGGISAIRFLANSFQIVDPGGTAKTEYSAGTWTVHDSANRLRMKWGVW